MNVQAALIVRVFFDILYWAIIVRILLSWIPHNQENLVIKMLYEGTEPLLAPFRKLMPRSGFPLDLSPIIALLALQIIREVLVRALLSM